MAAVADLEQMTRMWAVEQLHRPLGRLLGPGRYRPQQLLPPQRDPARRRSSRCSPGEPTRPGRRRLEFGQKAASSSTAAWPTRAAPPLYRERWSSRRGTRSPLDLACARRRARRHVAPWQELESPRREHSPTRSLRRSRRCTRSSPTGPRELAEWLNPPRRPDRRAGRAAGRARPLAPAFANRRRSGRREPAARRASRRHACRAGQPGAVVQRVSAHPRPQGQSASTGRAAAGRALTLRCELSARRPPPPRPPPAGADARRRFSPPPEGTPHLSHAG